MRLSTAVRALAFSGVLLLTGCDKLFKPLFSGVSLGGTASRLNVLLIGQSNMVNFYGAGEATFAKNVPYGSVNFIQCAVGGTSIGQWQMGGALMNQCQTHGVKPDLILFYQGESDAALGTTNWAQQFMSAVNGWRTAWDVPVIYAQIATCGPAFASAANWQSIQDQQASVFMNRVKMISTKDLTDRLDDVHLTPASERIVGGRFAVELGDL